MEKKRYPCQYPGTCKATFGRPADLGRHYMWVHAAANRKDSFPCDYAKCPRSRSNASFTRKDHYRDHLRDFHKEDIGCAKGQNKGKDRRQWEAKQKRWLEERNISHQHWRCACCLVKNYFYQVGWECSSCGRTCEGERISARWRIVGEKSSLEAGKSEESASTSHQNCNVCKGKSNLSGSWPPTCQASAPHQDFNAYEDFSASQNCNACNGNAWIEDVNRAWVACPMHSYQDFSVFGGTPWIQDTPIGIGDKIIAPHQDFQPTQTPICYRLDKQSGQQNETAIKDGQVRNEAAKPHRLHRKLQIPQQVLTSIRTAFRKKSNFE
jgi:hypothetical protein